MAKLFERNNSLRHKPYVKKVYSKRKETIERVFADAKEETWYEIYKIKRFVEN